MAEREDSLTLQRLMSKAEPWFDVGGSLKLNSEGLEAKNLGISGGVGLSLSDTWVAAVKASVELESMSSKYYGEESSTGSLELAGKYGFGKRHSIEFGPRIEFQYGSEWSLDEGEREDESYWDLYAGPSVRYRYHGLWAKLDSVFATDRFKANLGAGYSLNLEELQIPLLESINFYARLKATTDYDGEARYNAAVGANATLNIAKGWQAVLGGEGSVYIPRSGPMESALQFFAGIHKQISEDCGVEIGVYYIPLE